MKLLVLGGTVFLGRHIAEAARKAGHQVTLFNRGKSGPGLFPDLEHIVGDRVIDLGALRGRRWDVVIDTCGFLPQIVRASAELLREYVERYIFISSVSVYTDWSVRNQDETAPVAAPPAAELSDCTPETYGPLKAACEQVVAKIFPARYLVIRPGLIGGPFDPTDRFTYWPVRISLGGEVLAPGNPERTAQLIDVRDLASWTVKMASAPKAGIYNACGPTLSMREILGLCREEIKNQSELTWVDDDFLAAHGVAPYTDMPLWIPGINDSFDTNKAQADGLKWRALRETIRDTLAWNADRPAIEPRQNGLNAERERKLLKIWQDSRCVTASPQ